jgi:carnitine-CoA ligase
VPWLLMQGYDGLPDTTLAAWRNLWFHSGDFGYQGENGDFFFVDRVSDRIRRRAENISSSEIEAAALACGATEAAAVGVPSEYQGDDDIKLCVVVENWSPTELLEALARLLPPFMLPRYIERFGTLPRSATNKIRKSELRSRGVTESVWDRKKEGIVVRNFYV